MSRSNVSFGNLKYLVVDGEACAPFFVDLVASLVKYMDPPAGSYVIAESGTYCGTMALCLGYTFKMFGIRGVVHTADPVNWGAQARIDANDLGDYVKYYQSDYLEMLPWIAEPIDIAIIDCTGWASRTSHIEHTLPLLRPGGLVIVDDMDQQPEATKAERDSIADSASLLLRGHRGCAILQKREDA